MPLLRRCSNNAMLTRDVVQVIIFTGMLLKLRLNLMVLHVHVASDACKLAVTTVIVILYTNLQQTPTIPDSAPADLDGDEIDRM